jgi:radical SAM superfamily enzyme YgiQ (UPF0313 family)
MDSSPPSRYDSFRFAGGLMPDLLNNPIFRPPAEADSLILQVDQGCPYNRCTFCGMYRNVRYRRLTLDEISRMIDAEARADDSARRVFLADGDVMRRPYEELSSILRELQQHFPGLARVSTYATGSAIASKTADQLAALRAARLNTLYMGLESGDDEILSRARKGEDARTMVEAARRARDCGLKMSVMVLLGLGGAEHTAEHAEGTIRALNAMQPRLLSALRVVPVPGTELYGEVQSGRFRQLTERQVVEELRRIIAGLDLDNTVFRANHTSNVIPLEARFPRDRRRLLSELDALLASGTLDDRTPGSMPLWL